MSRSSEGRDITCYGAVVGCEAGSYRIFSQPRQDDRVKSPQPTRYAQVSRRALLKGSLGASALALIPGLACGNDDESIFAGASARPVPTTTPPDPSATTPFTTTPSTTTPPTTAPSTTGEANDQPATGELGQAVAGEMVIAFTYTQGLEGKNEPPYVAVWVEDSVGDLVQTIALWYQQGRKGERWLDHLTRWYSGDADRLAGGGPDNISTISSATRQPGSYTVVWDGAIDGTSATVGDYFVCIESVREDGPYSLIREQFFLDGQPVESPLPDTGELSAASMRIDV